MRTTITLILLILGVFAAGFGQVNDRIKDRSSSNTRTNTGSNSGGSRSGGSNGDGGDGSCAGACLGSCLELGCAMAVSGIAQGMFRYNRRIMDRKPEVPRVISLDIIPQAGIGFNSNNTWIIMPRVRGNLGLFSTDFRFYNRLESGVDYIDTWKTLEWQILQLNLVQGQYGNFRIGSGIYYESFEGRIFNEHTVGLSLYVPPMASAIDLEYRLTPDYATGDIPRQEGSIGFRRILIHAPHLHIYGTVSGMYQNFYRGVEAWSGVAGLHINLH